MDSPLTLKEYLIILGVTWLIYTLVAIGKVAGKNSR